MAELVIEIEQGALRGKAATDFQGKPFYKFQGIPYARPPLGNLRFKAPQEPEKWEGILDATKERDICYCKDFLKNNQICGSENCLFLNVYTSKLPKDDPNLRPVMFWIHGGGYTFGSGNEDLYGADYLVSEDVVIVTLNYRLGLLGFLSFDDPSLGIPGNAGLKDQIMALKWVQKNISHFGGDPNNVTIFGESAGGASVHLLMLSPMGKGLFHKAIAQSGCALNPWLEGRKGTDILAELLNVEANDKTVYEAIKNKPVDELYKLYELMEDDDRLYRQRPLGLVVEKNTKEAFLDKTPLEIMSSGEFNQVPLIIGYTSSEGMMYELHKKPNASEMPPLEEIIPWSFKCNLKAPETKVLAEKIKKFYFNGREYSPELATQKYNIFSDCQFLHGIYTTLVHHFQNSKTPIYLYRFSAETSLNFLKILLKIEKPGACHCDDIGYLFRIENTPKIQTGSLEETLIKRFIKLWTNFAKFGNPTPEKSELLKVAWKPVESLNFETFEFGDEMSFKENPELERLKFWEQLFAASPGSKTQVV